MKRLFGLMVVIAGCSAPVESGAKCVNSRGSEVTHLSECSCPSGPSQWQCNLNDLSQRAVCIECPEAADGGVTDAGVVDAGRGDGGP